MPTPFLTSQRRQAALGLWVICSGLMVACGGEPVDDSEVVVDDTSPVDDTGEPATGPLLGDLQVEVSTIVPTVARLRWTSRRGAEATVRFGVAGELAHAAEVTEDGDARQAYLLGLLPDTDYAFRVSVAAGDESDESDEQTFHTGLFPVNPPTVTVSSYEPESAAGGFTIVPMQAAGDCWTTVLNEQGMMVWAKPIECMTHRTRLAHDGSGFISQRSAGELEPIVLEHVSFFGEPIEEIAIGNGHHDFTIVEHGTYAVLGYTERSFYDNDGEEQRLVGDTILEVDPEGRVRVVWDIFDHVEPVLNHPMHPSHWSEGAWDYSHGNYINYVAAEDAYYVSCRALNALFKIDRASGELIWTFSEGWGDFANLDDEPLIDTPHSVELVDGGLLYFNQWSDVNPGCSEAVRARLDMDAGTAERVWSYETSDCLTVEYLGNAWPLSNGNTLVIYSFQGQADEVTPAGAVVQRMTTDFGWWLSYAERVESLYSGTDLP